MAQEDTPTTTADPTTASGDDPVSLIEDNIVRRLVRVAVHVRGYAPYYAATVAFGVMLLVVPALGGGSDEGDAVASGVAGTTAAPATTSTPSTTPRSDAPAELASSAEDLFTPPVTTEATRSNGSTYSFDDYDYDTGDDSSSPANENEPKDKPCAVEPPDGAPVSPLSPEREAGNVQNTLESAAGQEAPAESSEAVGSAVEASGACDDDTSTESLPDPTDAPAAPASTSTVDDEVIVDLAGNMFLF